MLVNWIWLRLAPCTHRDPGLPGVSPTSPAAPSSVAGTTVGRLTASGTAARPRPVEVRSLERFALPSASHECGLLTRECGTSTPAGSSGVSCYLSGGRRTDYNIVVIAELVR